jgi:hypothetical protein
MRVLALASWLVASAQTPPPAAPPPALEWQHTFAAAKERAAADRKPLLVVVMDEPEVACREMFDRVYTDAEVAKKLASFVLVPCCISTHTSGDGHCPRYRGVDCTEHQAIEKELRARFADPVTQLVTVPQHAVLDAAGKLILKRVYLMTRDGFLTFLDSGLAYAKDPVAAAKAARGPVLQKAYDAIVLAKKDEERELGAVNLFSEWTADREILLFDALDTLKSSKDRGLVVRAAGRPEHKAWAPSIGRLLVDKDPFVRDCAVVTLEEEGNTAVLPSLLATWESEKDPEVRKDVLRALGPCGGASDDAKKVLVEALASPTVNLRVAAALSLGFFLRGDDEVAKLLEERWPKEHGTPVALAILWGIGNSKDASRVALAERLVKGERDANLVKIAGVVRVKIERGPEAAMSSLGAGSRKEIFRLLAPIHATDKVARNAVRDVESPRR